MPLDTDAKPSGRLRNARHGRKSPVVKRVLKRDAESTRRRESPRGDVREGCRVRRRADMKPNGRGGHLGNDQGRRGPVWRNPRGEGLGSTQRESERPTTNDELGTRTRLCRVKAVAAPLLLCPDEYRDRTGWFRFHRRRGAGKSQGDQGGAVLGIQGIRCEVSRCFLESVL